MPPFEGAPAAPAQAAVAFPPEPRPAQPPCDPQSPNGPPPEPALSRSSALAGRTAPLPSDRSRPASPPGSPRPGASSPVAPGASSGTGRSGGLSLLAVLLLEPPPGSASATRSSHPAWHSPPASDPGVVCGTGVSRYSTQDCPIPARSASKARTLAYPTGWYQCFPHGLEFSEQTFCSAVSRRRLSSGFLTARRT
jgi:hypothetical protein